MTSRLLMSLACVVVLALPAVGQSSPPDPREDDGGVLAGPRVEDDAQGQGEPMMGPQGQQRRRAQDVPFQRWMGALRGLALTDEQQSEIRAIADEFQAAQRAYQQSLSDEDRQAMQAAREARQAGSPPDPRVRERVAAIEAGRPKAADYQGRIWDTLSAAQQEQMKARLDEMRRDMNERRQGARERPAAEAMDQMEPPDKETSERPEMAPGAEERPAAAPRQRRGARGRLAFDEIGKRRLEFLRSKQSASARRPDRDPAEDERRFDFED